jgi:hypothetical protein
LLSAGPFGFIEERQGDEKGELVIHAPQCFAQLSGHLRLLKIKYGFDVVHVSVVPIYTKIISDDYIPGTSFDPLSENLLTNPNRGPPRLIDLL